MTNKNLSFWFRLVCIVLVLWGIVFIVFGLKVLPVQREVLLDWETALYGAIMMGWGLTLFFIGGYAFRKNDKELMRYIFYGLALWLVVEAGFSAYLGVWFNVGVDIGVFLLFSYPLFRAMRTRE